MREMTTRRGLLATLGVAALAGCAGLGSESTGTESSSLKPSPPRTGEDAGTRKEGRFRTYHVDTSGSNENPGTENDPLATIDEAVRRVAPGDKIVISGGTYERRTDLEISAVSGTKNRPIVMKGKDAERPIIQWTNRAASGGLRFDGVSHWHVSNLEIRNSPDKGVQVLNPDATHNVFKRLVVHSNANTGVEVFKGSNNRLSRIYSYNNYDTETRGEHADGVKISGREATGNHLRHVFAYRNSDDGIDLWTSKETTAERCRSWQNGHSPNGDGFGFKLGGAGSGVKTGGHRIVRCVAHENWSTGFGGNGSTILVTLYNTTAHKNPTNYRIRENGHELVNNLAWNGESRVDDAVSIRSNSWQMDIGDPQFLTENPSSSMFLHLSSSSPAINEGSDVGLNYAGEAPDLGAFEFHS